ncbi:hypothetical protein [Agarivorans gilvus]|uniref:Uncharacterized protein n=1 Tax=Agarivorans gilvus TaxID=680279 RepID=A0ABQ1I7Q7_9ALTE|nr:hypothetical protein [Agarivorans gilvus]GGB17017.1 hypothetical protein GCM10007414_33090 [Agarivorans gilvus]
MNQKICPTLVGLIFDEQSQRAINDINRITKTKKTGWFIIAIGQLALIFGGNTVKSQTTAAGLIDNNLLFKSSSNGVSQTGYNIYTTNWEYFFQSFSHLEHYAEGQISTIAGLQMIRSNISAKERQFWKAIHYGCKPQ